MMPLFVLLFAGLFVYTVLVLFIAHGLGRVRDLPSGGAPPVSVVVAARNEERNIRPCLDSLRHQDYPPDRFEVIIADDRSDDGTSAILHDFAASWPALRVVRIDSAPPGISPKKHALAAAIALARGDVILQTDADCIVPERWIAIMARRFGPGVGFVAGVAPYRESPGLLNSFIRHEYLWNAGLSAASIALGRGTHASGRNMGFRRDVFEQLGGYGESMRVASGDDTLLLHRVMQSGTARAVTQPDSGAHVYTGAPVTMSAFLRQRARHLSTGRYFESAHLLLGGAVYGFHALLLAALLFSLFRWDMVPAAFGAFFLKAGVDAAIAFRLRSVLGLSPEWRAFIRNEFFLLVYMTVIPLAGFLVPVSWKNTGGTGGS